jgi:hypothetical protein
MTLFEQELKISLVLNSFKRTNLANAYRTNGILDLNENGTFLWNLKEIFYET